VREDQKKLIKSCVSELIERLAQEQSLVAEAVADIAFLHIQKHASWGRNPTKPQKKASHQRWNGCCQRCDRPVAFDTAVFHHLRRRIQNQHGPENLVPLCPGCHDNEHGARRGSLSKGTPTRARKTS